MQIPSHGQLGHQHVDLRGHKHSVHDNLSHHCLCSQVTPHRPHQCPSRGAWSHIPSHLPSPIPDPSSAAGTPFLCLVSRQGLRKGSWPKPLGHSSPESSATMHPRPGGSGGCGSEGSSPRGQTQGQPILDCISGTASKHLGQVTFFLSTSVKKEDLRTRARKSAALWPALPSLLNPA